MLIHVCEHVMCTQYLQERKTVPLVFPASILIVYASYKHMWPY